jgi:hypothetical protein
MNEQSLSAPENITTPAAEFIGRMPVVKTSADKQVAFDNLQLIKGEIKRLDADRKAFTDPIRKTINAIIERYDLILNPLKAAEVNFKKAIETFDSAEAARIAKENERLRVEAEEKARKEQEKLARQAEKAAEKGNAEKAESLRALAQEKAATPVVAPVIQQEKTKGLSYVDTWDAVVVDKKLIPNDYLIPNIPEIEAFAKRTQGSGVLPGVRFVHRRIVKATSR